MKTVSCNNNQLLYNNYLIIYLLKLFFLSAYLGAYKDEESKIDCSFVDNESCLRKWKVTNFSSWSFISTSKKPMGPVFDRRWEGDDFLK